MWVRSGTAFTYFTLPHNHMRALDLGTPQTDTPHAPGTNAIACLLRSDTAAGLWVGGRPSLKEKPFVLSSIPSVLVRE